MQLGGWRWAFLVNLPFGLVAVVGSARTSSSRAGRPGRRVMPDLVGAALLVVSLALLNLGIIKGGDWGWTSPEVLGSFVGAAVALGLFVRELAAPPGTDARPGAAAPALVRPRFCRDGRRRASASTPTC